jgi:hypothetical protein
MINVSPFEDEIDLLKKTYEHGSYEYKNPSDSFKACTNSHFNGVKRKERYGVYVVRHRDTQEVLYIGKGGTIDFQGKFKRQNILKRLRNVKEGNISADIWFRNLLQEKGPLIIEYIFLLTSKSPALIEAALLQAYLNEYHCLPYKNKSL